MINGFFGLLTGLFPLSLLVWRHFNVAWYSGPTTKRTGLSQPANYESEGGISPGAKVLGLDWRFDVGITVDIPRSLGNQGGV